MRAPNQSGYERGNEDFNQWVPLRVNNRGLRGADIPEFKSPGELRVLCLGDSFVFGGGLGNEDTYPTYAQKLCGLPETQFRFMNGGGNGFDGREASAFLERLAPVLRPNIVIFGWNWNDLVSISGGSSDRYAGALDTGFVGTLSKWTGISTLSIRRLSLVKLKQYYDNPSIWKEPTRAEFHKYRDEVLKASTTVNDKSPDAVARNSDVAHRWELARQALGRMNDYCKRIGAKFMVLIMPELTWKESGSFVALPRLEKILQGYGIPYRDTQPDFYTGFQEKRHMVQKLDPFHPSAEGQRVIAENVIVKLKELGWLGQK